jgi:hypothetical protein
MEAGGLTGAPIYNAESPHRNTSLEHCSPLKKGFFFSPSARWQFSGKKWRTGSTRVNPQENRQHVAEDRTSFAQIHAAVSASVSDAEHLSAVASRSDAEHSLDLPEPRSGLLEPPWGKGTAPIAEVESGQDTLSTSASSDAEATTPISSEGQDTVSTSACSDGNEVSFATPTSLSDDGSDTLSNPLKLEVVTTNQSKDLLSIVQGHWVTLRDTPVRVTGSQALWIRDSVIDLGGTLTEVDEKLQLRFSDGSIYTAELNETETVLTWSDGDVWRLDTRCPIAPALVSPTLSESFAKVLNADQKGMTAKRRSHRKPSLPATLPQQNNVTVSHAQPQNCMNTSSLSPEQSCEEVSEVPQIIRCKDGVVWLRFQDGRTYHAALQPEAA